MLSKDQFLYVDHEEYLIHFLEPHIVLDGSIEDIVEGKTISTSNNNVSQTTLGISLRDGVEAEKIRNKDSRFNPNEISLNVKGNYKTANGNITIESVSINEKGEKIASGTYNVQYRFIKCRNSKIIINGKTKKEEKSPAPECDLLPSTIRLQGAFSEHLIKE